jgi:cytidylate kinase
MVNFKNFLTEGVDDKHIFKAFFLAGGPGSGKSWVSARTLEGSGMKVINSDAGFERYAIKVGLDLKKMSSFSNFQQRQKEFLRQRSKSGTQTQLQYAVDGRLGLILDSTARDIDRIEREKRGLDFTGYDTYMVFVNTTLETALKRNQMRPRSVPDGIVRQSHKQIQANRQKLKNIFGSNYVEVDNDFDLPHINSEVYKKINKLKKKDPSKKAAKDWIAIEREMKRQAGQKKTSVFSLFGRRK